MFKLWSFQCWRDTSTWHLRLYSRSLLNPAPSHSSSQSHPLWETTKRMVTSINVTSNQNPNWVLNRNLRVANFHPHILSMHLFSSTSSSSSSWSHVVCGAATNAHFDKLHERHAYSVVVHTYSLHAPLTMSCSWKEGRIRSRILFGSFWILSRWHCFHILCCCDDKGAAGERAGPAAAVPDASQNHHHHFLYLGCKQKRAAIPVDRANKQFTLVKWFYWAKNRPIHQPWYSSGQNMCPQSQPTHTTRQTRIRTHRPAFKLSLWLPFFQHHLPKPSGCRGRPQRWWYPLKSCRAPDEKVAKVEESEEEQEEEVGK